MSITYKIPATNLQYSGYSSTVKTQIKSRIDSIDSTYGFVIGEANDLTKAPKKLISSFIFIESDGNPNAVSPVGAVGLMQLLPSSASDIIVLENMKGRLTEDEKTVLRKYLGNRLDNGILKMKYLGQKVTVDGVKSATWVMKEDLFNPELNVLIGSIYLKLLIDEEKINGQVRLDRVAVRYNKGYFSKLQNGDINVLLSSNIPQESKNYILKLVGVNGVLDAIV